MDTLGIETANDNSGGHPTNVFDRMIMTTFTDTIDLFNYYYDTTSIGQPIYNKARIIMGIKFTQPIPSLCRYNMRFQSHDTRKLVQIIIIIDRLFL